MNPELIRLCFVAAAALLVAVVGLVVWRRDRVHLLLLGIGPVLGVLAASALGWQGGGFIGVLCLTSLSVSVIGYWLARWERIGFSSATALIGGGAAPLLTVWILAEVGMWMEHGPALLLMLPVGLGAAGVLTMALYAGRAALRGEAPAGQAARPGALGGREGLEERRIILDMLAQGKVSAAEAAELLEAVGPAAVAADRLPLTGGIVASLVGGMVVVIGWAMPWRYEEIYGIVYFQAGYHMSLHGWLVLILGVVPAMLACMPALDNYLRQGMVRLFLGLIGTAFAGSLLSLSVRVGEPSAGLALCLLGFGVQVAGALKESGLVRGGKSAE